MTTVHHHHSSHLERARGAVARRRDDDVAHAIAAVREQAALISEGERLARSPHAVAFLDDGRRVFFVVDHGRGRPAHQPRSWGVEVTIDNDLTSGAESTHVAVRSTAAPTPASAEDAARYVLAATA